MNGFSRRLTSALLGLACLAAATAQAGAVVLLGSSRTVLYSQKSRLGAEAWEVPSANGARPELDQRTTLLESLRLDALALGLPGLSFHTAASGTNVLTDQNAGQTRFRLYRAFLQAEGKRAALGYNARLGRTWVLAGVGTGVVDGVSLGLRLRQIGSVDGFFGTLGSDRITRTDKFWDLDKTSESRSLGGRARLSRNFGLLTPTVAVSYVKAERARNVAELGASEDLQLVTDAERYGIHAEVLAFPMMNGRQPRIRLFGETVQDLVFGHALVNAGGIEITNRPCAMRLKYEYGERRPWLRATSFFASFDSRPVKQHRLGAGLRFYRDLRFDVNGDITRFESVSAGGSEKENGLQFLLSGWGLTAGYRVHGSYGGDLSGLVFYGHRDITPRLYLDASVDYEKYKYGQVSAEDAGGARIEGVDDSATQGIVAASYRLLPRLSLTGQVEGMQNPDYNQDIRFLGIVQWNFRTAL